MAAAKPSEKLRGLAPCDSAHSLCTSEHSDRDSTACALPLSRRSRLVCPFPSAPMLSSGSVFSAFKRKVLLPVSGLVTHPDSSPAEARCSPRPHTERALWRVSRALLCTVGQNQSVRLSRRFHLF